MLIYIFPFLVLVLQNLAVVGEEVALQPPFIEDAESLADDILVTPTSDNFCLLRHFLVVQDFFFCLGIRIDVNPDKLMTYYLHGNSITESRIVIQIVREHSVLQLFCSQRNSLTNLHSSKYFKLVAKLTDDYVLISVSSK